VQKEVAHRICSQPGSKDYGILSVAAGLLSKAKIEFDISPSCFYPKPKVVSTIIEIQFDVDNKNEIDFNPIMKLVKASFGQRRKVLKNSLKDYLLKNFDNRSNEIFQKAEENSIDYFAKRAEELSVKDFIIFYNFLEKFKKEY
ncbi:MAG: rRNA adenine N-6-methyltransferase family protein, partial [FCB group bacterium]